MIFPPVVLVVLIQNSSENAVGGAMLACVATSPLAVPLKVDAPLLSPAMAPPVAGVTPVPTAPSLVPAQSMPAVAPEPLSRQYSEEPSLMTA